MVHHDLIDQFSSDHCYLTGIIQIDTINACQPSPWAVLEAVEPDFLLPFPLISHVQIWELIRGRSGGRSSVELWSAVAKERPPNQLMARNIAHTPREELFDTNWGFQSGTSVTLRVRLTASFPESLEKGWSFGL